MRPPDMYDPGGSSSSRPHGKVELQPEVVLYTASASRRRGRASADLYALRALLRSYRLTVDERDVSTSKARRSKLKSLLASRGCAFSLPQLLVGGRLVGDPDDVRQLHHGGGLRTLLDGAPRPSPAFVCQACKRVGSEPCPKCSESRNKMLDHGIIEEEEKEKERVVLFYPTQDVSMGGRGGEMDVSFSVSLGAMRPLLKKLDMMLGPHGCRLNKGVNDGSQFLKDDLEEIGAYLEDLSEAWDPPLAAKNWMKEAHELSYDILDCIDNFVPPESLGYKSDHKMTHVKIPKRLKWQKQIEYAAPDVLGHVISKTIRVDVIRAPRKFKWYQQMVEKVEEFMIYAREAIRRYERYHVQCCSTSAARRYSAIGPIMPMPPLPCEKTCFGLVIDGRMSKFINSLANDADQPLKVVSIHGSGCLGKTMLAKVLYHKIWSQFHCWAFIRVSKKPDMKRLFCDMISQIQRKQPKASQDASDELCITAENIRNYLHGKRLVFNSIPPMDQRLDLYSKRDQWKQYRHGTALISIERMTGLREVSAKFGGAAADLQYVSRMGVVSNHPGNPIIDVQLVDCGSHGHGDKRISWSSPESSSRLLPPGVEEGGEQQVVVSWSNTIDVIGRELFIYCLHRLSRWDYASIASLNHDFNSVVRNGDMYRLRRKNGVAEHWLYLSCGTDPSDWEAYDPSTGRWIQVPKMPPAVISIWIQVLAVGTELLVFGVQGRVALRYSILTNSWTGLADADADAINTPRYLFGSASVGEKAYVAGGVDSSTNVLSSAEMYESETHTWTPLPSMNRARCGCSGAFMDGKLYVIGGISRSREVLTCGEEYDLNLRSWRLIDNMSQGLNQTVIGAPLLLAVVNNELYAADYSESNELKQYDKLDNKWITLGKLPVQSKYKNGRDMGFRACGDRLIVIGRPNNSSDEKVVELHSWTPDGQPPVWNFLATRPYGGDSLIKCAVMGC